MENLYNCNLYMQDIEYVASLPLPWDRLNNRTVILSGATGLIGSFLCDVLIFRNHNYDMNCTVIALGRDRTRAEKRFGISFDDSKFCFVEHDVNLPLDNSLGNNAEYIIHLASNTHPLQYSSYPISTIMTNILGTKNMLDIAIRNSDVTFVFASSNEVYGENRGDKELFDESYCGYIDSNTLRAGYPESKRCGEALCQAYFKELGVNTIIPRFTRSYGPTMQMTDSKAMSQFLKKAIDKEDIVLKSPGEQYYSYCYVADAVSGLLTVMLKGSAGEAYNIADERSDIKLKDLAMEIAGFAGTKVVFEIPDGSEAAGYSTATKARLDGTKLRALGWDMKYDIRSGVKRTLDILESCV